VLSFPEVQRIVVGVDTVSQLEEIMAAAVFRTGAMPVDIRSHDVDLLNPSRWTML
jgi:antitoxin component of RelBE/YafQ-DinJ toxin-antitoxin module